MAFSKEELESLKEQFGISAEAVEALAEMVSTKIKEIEYKAEVYAEYVKEEMAEKAEAYGEYIKEELSEQAEAYGEYIKEELSEKAEEYAEHAAEEYGQYVKEEMTKQAEAYGEYIKEELTEKVSEYTDYAMNEFISEHKEKFEKLELFERMESAFQDMKDAFEKNAFRVDESHIVNEMRTEVKKAEKAFGKVFSELQATKEKLEEAEMALLFEAETRDLTDTQKARLKNLSENVKFDGIEDFKVGLSMLIEQVKRPGQSVPTPDKDSKYLKENLNTNTSSTIDAVLKALQR